MTHLSKRMQPSNDDTQRSDMKPAFSENLFERVTNELATASYQPSPVRRVDIDKPDGGKRQLGIPTVTDRVIQQAIGQILTPIFDPSFSERIQREYSRRIQKNTEKRIQDRHLF